MNDPDRLTEIQARREAAFKVGTVLRFDRIGAAEAEFIKHAPGDIDWLVAELKDRRTDLAVALSQLQDALTEIARLRALLEPSVTMTSPYRTDPENDEGPPSRS